MFIMGVAARTATGHWLYRHIRVIFVGSSIPVMWGISFTLSAALAGFGLV
jgi:hypothetical protein